MTVQFDPQRGSLRLDQNSFDRLVGWLGGETDEDSQVLELRQSGVLVDDKPHPIFAGALDAVANDLCQLRLDLIDADGDEKSGDGWFNANGAALLLDLPGSQLRDLVSLHATLLPAAIARVVRLAPHPLPGREPLPMSRTVFESLLSADPKHRASAAEQLSVEGSEPPLPALIDRLVSGPWRRWTASMAWFTPLGEPASRTLQVLDTDACLCLCDVTGNSATLWPTSATGVWRQLTLLLPTEVDESGIA